MKPSSTSPAGSSAASISCSVLDPRGLQRPDRVSGSKEPLLMTSNTQSRSSSGPAIWSRLYVTIILSFGFTW